MAKTYNLNCLNVMTVIQGCCKELFGSDNFKIEPDSLPTDKDKCEIKIKADDKELLLVIYFKVKGQSFNVQGKNQELTNKIRDKVIEQCSLSESETSLTVRGFSRDNFDSLIKSFQNDEKLSQDGNLVYKVHGKYKAELTITYYDNKTLFIQGRPSLLFNEMRYFLCDKTPFKDLIDAECKKEYVALSEDSIDAEYNNLFGSVDSKFTEEIKKFIYDSLAINKCDISTLNDKTLFITPICKALEYILTFAIEKNTDEIVDTHKGFCDFFGLNMKKHQFKTSLYKNKINEKTVECLEEGYYYYTSIRNVYFHARPHEIKIIEIPSEVDEILSKIGTCIFDIANNLL
ncbi:MAG: hypothetical protein HDR34_01665 [Treponema sp.]|nr:hypothetical protein [Treponema sp.]